jgi:uncharacterized damage-inducible protein DinB
MPRPDLQTVPPHLHEEVNLVTPDDVKEAFSTHHQTIDFLKNIPEEKWTYRYAEGKWNIKEVVQHIIDGERIFCNRALVIARQDKTTPLPSFDGDDYAKVSNADRRTKEDLIAELQAVQQSSKKLFESFDNAQLRTKGTVNDYTIEVNTLGFVIVGHTLHHVKLLKERYLKE